jgi:hypothetical protein
MAAPPRVSFRCSISQLVRSSCHGINMFHTCNDNDSTSFGNNHVWLSLNALLATSIRSARLPPSYWRRFLRLHQQKEWSPREPRLFLWHATSSKHDSFIKVILCFFLKVRNQICHILWLAGSFDPIDPCCILAITNAGKNCNDNIPTQAIQETIASTKFSRGLVFTRLISSRSFTSLTHVVVGLPLLILDGEHPEVLWAGRYFRHPHRDVRGRRHQYQERGDDPYVSDVLQLRRRHC